nr:ribonuclease H-like domain-containing protein [Tanacetum cinerariifolium]
AVATACYTQNRSIIRLRHGKTPYELMHNKLPDLSFLHVFGAICYPINDSENLGKLQPKADIGIFIGYAPTKKDLWIYNRRTRRIVKTIPVDFDELTTMASEQSSSGPALNEMTHATIRLEDIIYSDDEDVVGAEADFKNLESSIPIIKDQGGLSQMFGNDFHTCMFACFLSQEEPKREEGIDYEDVFAPIARIEAIRLFLAYASFMGFMVYQMDVKSTFLYGTIEEEVYVCQPPGFEDPNHPDKVYKVVKALYGLHQAPRAWNKKDERGIVVRNKARFVAQGHTQEERIDYEEVFAPVARIEAIRLFLAYASFMGFMMYQMDVKSAFLYGTIKEEVYACQPLGFEDPDYPDKFTLMLFSDIYLLDSILGFELTLQVSLSEMVFNSPMLHLMRVEMVLNSPWIIPILGIQKLASPKANGSCTVSIKLDITSIFIDSPLLRVNTPRSDEDRLKILELTVFVLPKVEWVEIGITAASLKVTAVRHKLLLFVWLIGAAQLMLLVNVVRHFVTVVSYELTLFVLTKVAAVNLMLLGHKLMLSRCLSAKRTAWNEFSCSMASAVICLVIGRNFNFSKYIFDSMVRNVDSPSKFLMYRRFLQVVMDNQVDDMTTHNTRYTSLAFTQKNQLGDLSSDTTKYISPALTQKVFANMRRVGKGFLGVETPLFAAADFPFGFLQTPLDTCTALSSRTEQLKSAKMSQALEISKQKKRVKRLEKSNKVKVLKLRRLKKVGTSQRIDTSDDTIMEDVWKQAKIYQIDMDHPSKVLSMQEDEPAEVEEVVEVVTTAKLIIEVVAAASKSISVASTTIHAVEPQVPATTPTDVPVRVAAASTRRRKGVVIRDPEEESTAKPPADTKSKDKGKGIIDDLESLWSIVKERFCTTKPDNFIDDFLLTTLRTMFEEADDQAQIWKNQRTVHGQARVKSWKLLELCGVRIVTLSTIQLILLVKTKYPLSRYTLDQMLNAEDKPDEVEEVVEVVGTAKLITEVVATAKPKPMKKKKQVEMDEEYTRKLHEELNPDIDWDVAIDIVKQKAREDPYVQRLDYFKGMSYDDIHLIFETKLNTNIKFLLKSKEEIEEEENKALESINETPAQKAAKRRKLNEEVAELNKHLEIVPDEDDDVLQRLLYLLERDDLESLWSIVKERFSTTKPDNFIDDFLLTTLRTMFEEADDQAQIWKNQRTVHGQARVKSWKLLESCGVHIETLSTIQLILLVERKYPLSRYTLDQMINAVRLRVEEQSEMSLEMSRIEQLKSAKMSQALEISKQNKRVKRLEKSNKVKVLKLRRLKKVGTSQRIDTSDDTIIEDEDEPAEVEEVVEVVTTGKLIIEVVAAASKSISVASTTIHAIEPQVPATTPTVVPVRVAAASTRRRKGVVIRDPEEESTAKPPVDTKSKDKGKGIMVDDPKPMKKK